MMQKKVARLRRGKKTRANIRKQGINRLSIHRTSQHIYAQVTTATGETTLVSASTVDAEIKKSIKTTSNVEAAAAVGKLVAERAVKNGIDKVAFDRSGFKYHGRVKALADAAREAGLNF